jgi:hypothetical protein
VAFFIFLVTFGSEEKFGEPEPIIFLSDIQVAYSKKFQSALLFFL